MSYEAGVLSADNGADGAANVFDIPRLNFSRCPGQSSDNLGENQNESLVVFLTTPLRMSGAAP